MIISSSRMFSPMGEKESVEQQFQCPVVHPELCVSENHFKKNTAFTDGKYLPLDEGRKAYEEAERVSFADITE